MVNRLDLDPQAVAAAGSSLAGIARRMADDIAALQGAVTGTGNPWGADETGSVFAGLYQAVCTHALDALGSYVEQVGFAAMTLSMQAQQVAQADENAAADLSSPERATGR